MSQSALEWPAPPLLLVLPADYQLGHHCAERVAAPLGPPGMTVQEEFRRWEAPGPRALHLFYWQPRAPRPGGPLHAVAEWAAVLGGQPVRVLETDLFMGRPQQVLVTHLELSTPAAAQLMLYATGLTREEFGAILAAVRWAPAIPAPGAQMG